MTASRLARGAVLSLSSRHVTEPTDHSGPDLVLADQIVDERLYLDVISGRRNGLAAGALRTGLSLLSPLYRAGVGTRNSLYRSGIRPVHRVGVPVVSIGNITTGGTGKTPMVAWMARWLMRNDRQPCIISRGYRAIDGEGNDELRVLEQLCPAVRHIQNRDRVAAARQALATSAPDVLILDDGFQHRRLARDVDLVLVDALCPWGHNRLLPRGLLREPKSALARADAVALTRADLLNRTARERLKTEISQYTTAPVAEVAFRPHYWRAVDGQTTELSTLAGKRLLAFCGIGNPLGFRQTLREAGFETVPCEVFPDHHHYHPADFDRLRRLAEAEKAAALVTTQKDLVKLDSGWLKGVQVWALIIEADVISGRDALERVLAPLLAETDAG